MTTPARSDQIFTILKLGEREYELIPFLNLGETSVSGDEMVRRAETLEANLGEDEGLFILSHQNEIRPDLRGEITLVFPAWRNSSNLFYVAYVGWYVVQWVQRWRSLNDPCLGYARLVRRRPPTGEAGK